MPIPLSPPSPLVVRDLHSSDLPALLDIQRACYGDGFIESADVYARRLASPVNCSLVAERDGQVCAYLAAYRSLYGKVTPLHGDFAWAEALPDTLYLHDMAVRPSHAGQGLARALLERASSLGSGWGVRRTALVSVQDSQAYWARQGFVARPVHETESSRLATYGDGAVYMVRESGG